MIQERKKIVLSVFIVFALVAILLICLAPRVTPKLTTLYTPEFQELEAEKLVNVKTIGGYTAEFKVLDTDSETASVSEDKTTLSVGLAGSVIHTKILVRGRFSFIKGSSGPIEINVVNSIDD